MIYSGKSIQVSRLDGDIVKFHFNNEAESVNKFDQATNAEFKEAVTALEQDTSIKGLIVTSGKKIFIAGADITEFVGYFKKPQEELENWLLDINSVFNRFEDLPFPKVCAINGAALGGGCEMTLVCEYRVMGQAAQIGLPETKLGIFPGFGGSVRTPRIIGIDNALELIATGNPLKPNDALKVGLVDAVVADESVEQSALDLVKKCINGELDWQAKRAEKLEPVKLNRTEQAMAFNSAKGVIFAKANPKHYPAVALALDAIENHVNLGRDEAIKIEATNFAKSAKTLQAAALVGVFLNDQLVKKRAKDQSKSAHDINEMAVLGAGIMGGGIAYQSAVKGLPIIMKDIKSEQLDLGMNEASKLLSKEVERGKISTAKMGETLSKIRPTLNYGDFSTPDIVIEAVVENEKIKKSVLAETESLIKDTAVLASNTSTISITELAKSLKHPENFVGMHFFNPVHRMPLVEIIRGEKTSDEAVATTVALAQKMGKTPIVVNDCAGFLVNRVLFPYFGAFDLLIKHGADFVKIDKVMEKFGWPMGPAYLLDVVGIDTGVHASAVMANAFPERMNPDYKSATTVMFESNRLGQKNGAGFYKYELDKKGKPKKSVDTTTYELLKAVQDGNADFDEQEIIDRLMVAFCTETVRCLEDSIVASAGEADMAMLMGLGFPPFRGGPCRYIDQVGVKEFVALCDKYAHLGKAYEAPVLLREMAESGKSFYA
ncbi:fatty acid oxidation complex subunit alpha FadB [Moraxella bovis]|uniref:fatty acid oxidation complex subunit alpha FadB n=1 Tax=Moraxella bovis TaxID=476 RepID=UPI0009922ABF|nr:fatty acid oxidation complex subunit alpha FadB [Moraxella bovis]AWY19197.1 fatty acid oxidation complex subunit alpha FadB [Moraxella bovis]OOR88689.1 multifunctional fatty acid oxidation complex subunit alpha [Moraxella bovis]UYZ81038.1 fatty acid oxidation complex subunit alpha FadB [Moraxella bovis]UYZ89670.1 fatty acid oxidation complex subunit alpha FadB [Moraxella bovis]UYZ95236.1 fatty acid oxidation complex subunit alpha FadB [Moraxella bovis]